MTLREQDVMRIRELARKGQVNTREMARVYGVSLESIRRVIRGDTWMNLAQPKDETELLREAAASAERFRLAIEAQKTQNEAGDKIVEELKREKPTVGQSVLERAAMFKD